MALVFKLPDSRVDVFQKRDVTHFPEDDHLKNLTIDITVPSFGWCKQNNCSTQLLSERIHVWIFSKNVPHFPEDNHLKNLHSTGAA